MSPSLDGGPSYFEHIQSKGFLKESDYPPDLGPLIYYIDAFRELSSCRASSFSIGPIPFTAITEYFKIFGAGEFYDFLYLIRRMDSLTMLLHDKSKGAKQDGSAASKTNNSQGGHKRK